MVIYVQADQPQGDHKQKKRTANASERARKVQVQAFVCIRSVSEVFTLCTAGNLHPAHCMIGH